MWPPFASEPSKLSLKNGSNLILFKSKWYRTELDVVNCQTIRSIHPGNVASLTRDDVIGQAPIPVRSISNSTTGRTMSEFAIAKWIITTAAHFSIRTGLNNATNSTRRFFFFFFFSKIQLFPPFLIFKFFEWKLPAALDYIGSVQKRSLVDRQRPHSRVSNRAGRLPGRRPSRLRECEQQERSCCSQTIIQINRQ